LSPADDVALSRFNAIHLIIIKVWIIVDLLLLVRRLSLIVLVVRDLRFRSAILAPRDCIDQLHQPLAATRQNGGPHCAPRPTSDDFTSRDHFNSPEVVRMLGDMSLVYVTMSVGTVCLLVAALCACALLLDHFLSTVARGSFLLPVSTYFRSAVEFLITEARHLSASSATDVETGFELTYLQRVIGLFNTGLSP